MPATLYHHQPEFLEGPIYLKRNMQYSEERMFMGVFTCVASAFWWAGAILSQGDIRWLCISGAVSFMTSCLLALTFKKPDETMQLVTCRCALSILGAIFTTKLFAHYLGIESLNSDPINLGGVAFLCAILNFFLGFSALRYIEKNSDRLAAKWIDQSVRNAMKERDEASAGR
jgi:hypothetical protein